VVSGAKYYVCSQCGRRCEIDGTAPYDTMKNVRRKKGEEDSQLPLFGEE
jgi:hypothetical protein